MNKPNPRIVQIVVKGDGTNYGLDDEGNLWVVQQGDEDNYFWKMWLSNDSERVIPSHLTGATK